MSFYGTSFTYDDVSSDEFGLILYEIGGISDEGMSLATATSVIEDTLNNKWKPYFYGLEFNKKLSFTMTFGISQERIFNQKGLDRDEIKMVSDWLTCHTKYKYLDIEHPDMNSFRYKCIITDLSVVEYGSILYAFRASVECDSPFAYERLQKEHMTVNGTLIKYIDASSSVPIRYYPVIKVNLKNGGNLSIKSLTDNGREFVMESIPAGTGEITIDGANGVVVCENDLNLYKYIKKFNFVGMIHGANEFEIKCTGDVTFEIELPVNIGF